MTAPSTIRQLVAADAAAFRDIRLEGLRTAPEAFGSSYEAEAGMTDAEIAKWIGNGYIAGAWIDGKLIGLAGFFVESGAKSAHRGRIWGVYVRPAARGRGVAGALLEHLIAHARPLVEQVHLSVVTEKRRRGGALSAPGLHHIRHRAARASHRRALFRRIPDGAAARLIGAGFRRAALS